MSNIPSFLTSTTSNITNTMIFDIRHVISPSGEKFATKVREAADNLLETYDSVDIIYAVTNDGSKGGTLFTAMLIGKGDDDLD